jgi:hypothetical protein
MLEWFGDKYTKDYLLDLGGENRWMIVYGQQ